MSLLKRMFRPRPNGIHEIEELREARERSLERLSQSARRLARAVETVTRHAEDNELARIQERARKSGAH